MMIRPGPTFELWRLMLAVGFVAFAIAWSSRWSDCTYRAALHATLATTERRASSGERRAQWHDEMRRRCERARWLPWPFGPSEPPRPD
jgi:hypothetical protein